MNPGDSLTGSWLFPFPIMVINGQVPQLLPKKTVVGQDCGGASLMAQW